MHRESEEPLGVGTRWRGEIAQVGRVDVELIEYDPPRRVVHVARPWMAEALHVWEAHELADDAAWCSAAICDRSGWGGSSRR